MAHASKVKGKKNSLHYPVRAVVTLFTDWTSPQKGFCQTWILECVIAAALLMLVL